MASCTEAGAWAGLASLAYCFFTAEGFADAFLAGVLAFSTFFAGVAFLADAFLSLTGVSDFFLDFADFLPSTTATTFSGLFFEAGLFFPTSLPSSFVGSLTSFVSGTFFLASLAAFFYAFTAALASTSASALALAASSASKTFFFSM